MSINPNPLIQFGGPNFHGDIIGRKMSEDSGKLLDSRLFSDKSSIIEISSHQRPRNRINEQSTLQFTDETEANVTV